MAAVLRAPRGGFTIEMTSNRVIIYADAEMDPIDAHILDSLFRSPLGDLACVYPEYIEPGIRVWDFFYDSSVFVDSNGLDAH